ncbi:MAG: hypothetical protein M3361_19555 [Candidatus Tectomicrobia bacterium]|jgi:hypothetical protein|nr:hypothetical protein [Candidatus Tectomicrobia bacterium]
MQARLCYAIARALLGSGLLVSALPTLAQACAVCVGSSPEDAGYFWGVLFLMAMPFAVGGLIGGWLWYHYRRGPVGPVSGAPTAIVEGPSGRSAAAAPAATGLHDGARAIQA